MKIEFNLTFSQVETYALDSAAFYFFSRSAGLTALPALILWRHIIFFDPPVAR